MDKIDKAIRFAKEKFEDSNVTDQNGKPYYYHAVSMMVAMTNVKNIDYRIMALFQELLTKTKTTEAEIEAKFGQRIMKGVRLLTEKSDTIYERHILNIINTADINLIKAKKVFLQHNINRLPLSQEQFALYSKAFYVLVNAELRSKRQCMF